MKNLFKNLMLVAVAAMAFTACTETNDEVNAVSKTTRYEFTANIADETRSGFAEKEEGATAYKSEWFGDEYLKVYVTDDADFNGSYTTSIEEDGKFVLDLADAPESFSMTILSPAESWTSPFSCTIPTEQTPLANSVDPAAHLLWALSVPVNNGVADINMTHKAAYGKMTVNAPDFAIKKVEISFNGGKVYTLNATHVENNVFWFATEPIDAVAEFTVTAYDADDNAITKTVDVPAEKNMSFQYGRVGTFSVSGLEEYVAPEEDDTGLPKYDSAYVNTQYGQDRYVYFNSTDSSLAELRINFNGVFDTDLNTILPGTYSEDDYSLYPGYSTYNKYKVKDLTVTVSYVAEGYRIVFENVVDYSTGTLIFEKAVFVGSIEDLGDVSTAPKMILSTNSLTFLSTGGSSNVNVSFKNYSGAVEASSNNPRFTTSVSGTTVTVTAVEENTTEEEITGVITITSGELSATVDVIQKGASASNADGKTLDTAYTFTTYSVRYDGQYPVMQFQGSEDNAFFELESNSTLGYPTGRQYMNSGNWWTGVCEYKVNNETYAIDLSKSMTWLEGASGGYTLEYLYIVKDGDTEGLFYKYNGTFNK